MFKWCEHPFSKLNFETFVNRTQSAAQGGGFIIDFPATPNRLWLVSQLYNFTTIPVTAIHLCSRQIEINQKPHHILRDLIATHNPPAPNVSATTCLTHNGKEMVLRHTSTIYISIEKCVFEQGWKNICQSPSTRFILRRLYGSREYIFLFAQLSYSLVIPV